MHACVHSGCEVTRVFGRVFFFDMNLTACYFFWWGGLFPSFRRQRAHEHRFDIVVSLKMRTKWIIREFFKITSMFNGDCLQHPQIWNPQLCPNPMRVCVCVCVCVCESVSVSVVPSVFSWERMFWVWCGWVTFCCSYCSVLCCCAACFCFQCEWCCLSRAVIPVTKFTMQNFSFFCDVVSWYMSFSACGFILWSK